MASANNNHAPTLQRGARRTSAATLLVRCRKANKCREIVGPGSQTGRFVTRWFAILGLWRPKNQCAKMRHGGARLRTRSFDQWAIMLSYASYQHPLLFVCLRTTKNNNFKMLPYTLNRLRYTPYDPQCYQMLQYTLNKCYV
eukprot:4672005-Pyramimonas_sp.AAC.1